MIIYLFYIYCHYIYIYVNNTIYIKLLTRSSLRNVSRTFRPTICDANVLFNHCQKRCFSSSTCLKLPETGPYTETKRWVELTHLTILLSENDLTFIIVTLTHIRYTCLVNSTIVNVFSLSEKSKSLKMSLSDRVFVQFLLL